MHLIYRGQTYTTTNTICDTTSETTGTYRGQSYPIRHTTYLTLKPKQNLVYRGVAYHTTDQSIRPLAGSGIAPVYS
jgi:hypothetical protein